MQRAVALGRMNARTRAHDGSAEVREAKCRTVQMEAFFEPESLLHGVAAGQDDGAGKAAACEVLGEDDALLCGPEPDSSGQRLCDGPA
jgi:hypothetical protein